MAKSFKLFLASVGRRNMALEITTPPLGILSLAAYIRQQFPEAEIRVFDQRGLNCSQEELVRQIVEFKPDLAGFSALTSFAYMLKPLTEQVRKALPMTLTVIGGPHPSAFRAAALNDCKADMAVVGEGEIALEKLIQVYLDGGSYHSVPSLVWRDPDGQVIENPCAAPIADLDALPFPAYDLVDMNTYWKMAPMSGLPARKYVSLFTSRGCPYHCNYCHSVFGKRFRMQSAERIVSEVEFFMRKYGLREIEFLDDIFNCNGQRVLDFCGLAQQKDLRLRISFPNAIRTDILTEEQITALVDAGMYHSSFALETGTPRIQTLIGKNLNIPKFLRNVELATRKGVFAYGFVMLGFPTETEEEIKTTIDVACESSLHSVSFFTVIPYPQTALYALAQKTHPERLVGIDYSATDYAGIKINLSEVPDDAFYAYQRYAYRRFFAKPNRLLRLVRDYPGRRHLLRYVPIYIKRQLKGIIG